MTPPKDDCKEGLAATDILTDSQGHGLVDIRHPDHSHTLGVACPVSRERPPPKGAFLAKREADGVFRPLESSASSGPAKVNSDAFRDGWSRIFGGSVERGQA